MALRLCRGLSALWGCLTVNQNTSLGSNLNVLRETELGSSLSVVGAVVFNSGGSIRHHFDLGSSLSLWSLSLRSLARVGSSLSSQTCGFFGERVSVAGTLQVQSSLSVVGFTRTDSSLSVTGAASLGSFLTVSQYPGISSFGVKLLYCVLPASW